MSVSKVPGEAIRKIRHFKDLTQRQAAIKLCISQQAFSLLEQSALLKCSTVWRVLHAFDCSARDFEMLNGYPPPAKAIAK